MLQKKDQQYPLEEVPIRATTITIRKSFVILAVVLSVIAAYSQLFAEPNPQLIEEAKVKNKTLRDDRDAIRDKILLLSKQKVNCEISEEEFNGSMKNLLEIYEVKKQKSYAAYINLKKTRKNHEFNGFPHLNSFLAGFGVPFSFFLLTLLLFIIGLFLKKERYLDVSKSIFLVAQVSTVISLTYIIWALHPASELPRGIYVIALITTAFFGLRFLSWAMKKLFNYPTTNINHLKLKSAVQRLFEFIIIEINDKFIQEDQKSDFVESYDKEISRVSKIVK